jgi:hypothetical protein
MLIGTLRNAVTAMGGELEIRAVFPEGNVVRIQFEDVFPGTNVASPDDRSALSA